MNPFLIYWLIGLTIAAVFWLQARERPIARRVFVTLSSLFVLQTLAFEVFHHDRVNKVAPVIEADHAEMLLRFHLAINVVQEKLLEKTLSSAQIFGTKPKIASMNEKDFHADARKILETAIKMSPQALFLKARMAILLSDQAPSQNKGTILAYAKTLASSKETSTKELGNALVSIYSGKVIAKNLLEPMTVAIKNGLPAGWWRDKALLALYQNANQQGEYRALASQVEGKALRLFYNAIIAFAMAVIAGFLGLIVILAQLSMLARSKQTCALSSVRWGLKTVYMVFIFWMTTQIVVATFGQEFIKPLYLPAKGPLVAAGITAVVYLFENLPALFYINSLAYIPSKISFFEGMNFKLGSGKFSLSRLIPAGFFAWCASIPLVVVALLISINLFGSQGSTNPIIAVVLEASRTSNYLAAAIFYLTLAVLAPLCEEPLFRGFLFVTLRSKFGVGTALLISAALFAILHLDPGGVLPLFALGIVFAYTFESTGSILPSIIAHGLWNGMIFTLLLMLFSW